MSRYLLYLTFLIPVSLQGQNRNDTKLANEYYLQGDLVKAKDLFIKLSKNQHTLPEIHSNYFRLMLNEEDWSSAGNTLTEH